MFNKLKAISLFSGAGGMDVGFKKAGIEIVVANEMAEEAARTYAINHPCSLMINEDINKIIGKFHEYKNIDMVFGGPPCQGFSVAGKMDPNDERSKLIFSFLEAVENIKPKVFVMENVKSLASLEKWSSIKNKFLAQASQLGYTCYPFVLNATKFGVSQKRERVFFIGMKNTNNFEPRLKELLQSQETTAPSIRDLLYSLGPAGTEQNPHTCNAKITFALRPIMRKSPYAGMYFNGQGRPINIDEYANTLPASMGGNKTPFIDEEYLYGNAQKDWVVGYHQYLTEGNVTLDEVPKRLRRITIKEATRIQTFPDDYVFCGNISKVYTQIGNAVPCKLAEGVAKSVVKYLKETNY
ncbi:MAG: DNA cytosine methyltransferase [Epulopiscium sp. Nele67-Bin002]|nr:MAG: DNA (cytosine-5-)-methyltransferase [Epulopiscium sp. Nele67-Bin001]OON92654.1 MAG: DNA cytosine methyltransferase [Epulopiscium sp. Nele67-Bin002]